MIPQLAAIGVPLLAVGAYFRTGKGPLELATIALLHVRAALLCLRWDVLDTARRWRWLYPIAIERAKEWR